MARSADASKDQQLLNILRLNARTPLSDIAKQLGVTRATAQARLNRLERDGLIGGYTIVSGLNAQTQALFAVILVELEVRSQASVIAELKKIPEVVSCYTLSGQFDLMVRIRCRLSSELDDLIDKVAQIEGVQRTTSSIMLSRKFKR